MKYSESNKPLVCMQTQSRCYRNTREFKPLGVLWHSTGANNTDIKRYVQPSDNDPKKDELIKLLGKNKYGNDWNHGEVSAGLNCWIGTLADGTVATVQSMPWNYRPWGCGSGSKGSCNDTHIQFEICESDLNDKTYFNKVYQEACEITAYLCKMYNLDPKGTIKYNGVTVPVILCHADSCKLGLGSNHGDVLHWFKKHGKTMDDVRNDVAKLMGCVQNTPVISVSGTVSTGSEADQKVFWNYFLGKLGNEYGVAGLMGNIRAESNLRSDNLQNSYERKLGYTDKTYVDAVDNGTYTNFVNDSAGFGLAQWTYHSRKKKLLDYAKSKKKSIGDFKMQLDFLWEELQGYKNVVSTLKSATSVLEASRSVHIDYERPADQSEAAIAKRAAYCQEFYDKYAKKVVSESDLKLGDKVKLVTGAKYVSGQSIPSWVFEKVLYVREVNNDKIIISTLQSGAITGTVYRKDLAIIKDNVVTPTPEPSTEEKKEVSPFKIGDEVKLTADAKFVSGQSIVSWVFKKKLYVRAINGRNITISTLKSGAVTGTVDVKYLLPFNSNNNVVSTTPSNVGLKLGDKVKLVSGAKFASGQSIASWVFDKTLYVREINGDNIIISTLKSGAITGTVNKKYLTKI